MTPLSNRRNLLGSSYQREGPQEEEGEEEEELTLTEVFKRNAPAVRLSSSFQDFEEN